MTKNTFTRVIAVFLLAMLLIGTVSAVTPWDDGMKNAARGYADKHYKPMPDLKDANWKYKADFVRVNEGWVYDEQSKVGYDSRNRLYYCAGDHRHITKLPEGEWWGENNTTKIFKKHHGLIYCYDSINDVFLILNTRDSDAYIGCINAAKSDIKQFLTYCKVN